VLTYGGKGSRTSPTQKNARVLSNDGTPERLSSDAERPSRRIRLCQVAASRGKAARPALGGPETFAGGKVGGGWARRSQTAKDGRFQAL